MFKVLYSTGNNKSALVEVPRIDIDETANGTTLSFTVDNLTERIFVPNATAVTAICSNTTEGILILEAYSRYTSPNDLPGDVLDDKPVQTRIEKDFWSRTCDYYTVLSDATKSRISSQFSTVAHYLESRDYDSLTYIGKDKVLTVFLFGNYYFSTDKDTALFNKWERRFSALSADAQEFLRKTYPPFVYGLEKGQPPLCDDEVLDIIDKHLNDYLS